MEIHKELELQLDSELQEPTNTDGSRTWTITITVLLSATNKDRGVSPGLRAGRAGLLLSGPKLLFSDLAFHLEIFGGPLEASRMSGGAQKLHRWKSSVKV